MVRSIRVFAVVLLFAGAVEAQVTKADYDRAFGLREKLQGLALHVPERATWVPGQTKFWYRKSVQGGHEFVLMDATTQAKSPAFDHQRIAECLSKAANAKYTALTLPFQSFRYVNEDKAIEFSIGPASGRGGPGGPVWRVDLSDYSCKEMDQPRRRGQEWSAGPALAGRGEAADRPVPSPNGNWDALVRNHNIFLQAKGKKDAVQLSWDGSEGNYYSPFSIAWSPDSTKLVAYRTKPGYKRKIQYIESSPADQLQPKYSTLDYAKPGDVLDMHQPVLFDVATKKEVVIDNRLFPNAYQMSRARWWKDGRGFTFEYNQRGHQVYRVIEVSPSGTARAIINEEARTFFNYSGKKFREDINDGKEIVWMSERDGWNHLYLYDGITGEVKNQITKGPWVVRGVEKVDPAARQIWFRGSGMYPGKDPYFVHYYRINFDGSGLTTFTSADANHIVAFSSDMKHYVDTYSRVDTAPVAELRATADGKLIGVIERGDLTLLVKAGWRAPEVFTATARDGKTDIWGVIIKPSHFDASKKYPVVESIYAGPQDSFVPKSFLPYSQMHALAELGLIVVQIDGMGTSNRSKAFHDVAWKNLGDAGFPDRILWHKAVAAKYPWYDATRLGVYGHSAGGQSAMGALLFHPDFYKAAVSSCGCHDNRMDKIWWNEQWMGWPLGPEYAASSNVDNAWRLKGKLLLSVGEMDNNVDPASTMQVVNALIKAKKDFDLLVLPGQGHTTGGQYGDRKRYDFFVKHLLGATPPDWNAAE